MLICPMHKPVRVRYYARFRFNRWEFVTTHCRRWPKA